jgi:hypothetical protein
MKSRTKLFAAGWLSGVMMAASALAGTNEQTHVAVYGVAQNFQWKEFGEDGARLLKESGPLFGVGASLDIPFSFGPHLECSGDLLYGVVDYDGQRQDGVPAKTDTEYSWLRGEANLSLPLRCGNVPSVKPFAGIGGQFWNRNLEDTDNSSGYEEGWGTVYAQIGMGAAVPLRPSFTVFGSAAFRQPLANSVIYDFSRFGGDSAVEVEPGRKPTLRAEAGFTAGVFRLTAYYEQLRFSQSDLEYAGDDVFVLQPKSEADILGLTAGLTF